MHSNWCVPLSLHQLLLFWNDNNSVEVVNVDQKPFLALANNVEVHLYEKNVETVKLMGQDYEGKSTKVTV